MDAVAKLIIAWCKDDSNNCVLYKSNGDERYKHFKLYKMIARRVHKHTPANQLSRPEFSQFKVHPSKIGSADNLIDIDAMPSHAKRA